MYIVPFFLALLFAVLSFILYVRCCRGDKKLRRIVNNSNTPVFIVRRDGTILDSLNSSVSKRNYELLGEDSTMHNITDYDATEEDSKASFQSINKVLNTKQPVETNIHIKSKSGNSMIFNIWTTYYEHDKVICFIKDVTDVEVERKKAAVERERAEREHEISDELKKYTRKFELVAKAMKLQTWVMDVKTRSYSVDNDYRLPGNLFTPKIGETLFYRDTILLIMEEDRERVDNEMNRFLNGEIPLYNMSYRVNSTDPLGYYWEEAYAIVSEIEPETGKPAQIIGASMSIDKQKRLEGELIAARDKAEENNRLKSAFLSNMSHEIRTPLNSIVGFSDLLPDITDAQEKDNVKKIIKDNSSLLLQLINDILDLSKIEAGTLDFVYTDIDVNLMVMDVYSSFKGKMRQDVDLKIDLPHKHYSVHSDRHRIMQVLFNFMTNATKFTTSGYISIGFKVNDDESLIRFFVEDTGMGMSEEQTAAVFHRFVKFNNFIQGTGLGLSISYDIVYKLNGNIGVNSKKGEGSTFWFEIPCGSTEVSSPDDDAMKLKNRIENRLGQHKIQ